jgi:hypothetical protein
MATAPSARTSSPRRRSKPAATTIAYMAAADRGRPADWPTCCRRRAPPARPARPPAMQTARRPRASAMLTVRRYR